MKISLRQCRIKQNRKLGEIEDNNLEVLSDYKNFLQVIDDQVSQKFGKTHMNLMYWREMEI